MKTSALEFLILLKPSELYTVSENTLKQKQMNNSTKFLTLALVMIGFSFTSNAQNSATSGATTASATIVAPITITTGTEMAFGQVVAGATSGTVELAPAGTRTEGGGVTFSPGITGSPTASSFTVTGEIGYTYSVTLPSSAVTLTGTSGAAAVAPAKTMTVDTFTKSITTGDLATDGTETFTVGATLNVGAAQATGGYEGTYTVQVDYE